MSGTATRTKPVKLRKRTNTFSIQATVEHSSRDNFQRVFQDGLSRHDACEVDRLTAH